MNYSFTNEGWYSSTPIQDRTTSIPLPQEPLQNGYGWNFTGYQWIQQKLIPDVVIPSTQSNPTEFLIDVGPFFDRFGAAKMSILTSQNATVRAIVQDLQVRKWVDLKRPDVSLGIDALIQLGVVGITPALKNKVLTDIVTSEENLALRKMFFS
jgi:hypothetical protein